MRCQSFESGNFSQVTQGEIWQERAHQRRWRLWVAHQGRAHIVLARPLGVLCHGHYNALGLPRLRERLQDLALRKKRISKREPNCLRMAFGENSGSNT